MTGAVTVSGVVGMLSLFAGVALGWWLRRGSEWCPTCSEADQASQIDGAMLHLSRETLS